MLLKAVQDGLSLMMWRDESFAYADSFDEATGRYLGLRAGQRMDVSEGNMSGLVVKPDIAQKQMAADAAAASPAGGGSEVAVEPLVAKPDGSAAKRPDYTTTPQPALAPKRFHGSVDLDPTRVGRDAGKIAEEVIAHLAGLAGSNVKVTLEIEAEIPSGAPDQVVRTVTENSRTLKFTSQGFEKE